MTSLGTGGAGRGLRQFEGFHSGGGSGRGRGGTSAGMIPEMRGTRGSLPEGTSQPDDPDGVGGFFDISSILIFLTDDCSRFTSVSAVLINTQY